MASGADYSEANRLLQLLHTNLFVGKRQHREPPNITL